MPVKGHRQKVPTLGWTRRDVAATIRLVTQQQRDEIAARVRAEMDRQGFTNSKLARDAGLAEKTISRVVNARIDPRYDTLERIAKALGVEEKDLRGAPPSPLGLGSPSPEDDDQDSLERIEAALVDIRDLLAAGVKEVRKLLTQAGEAPELPGSPSSEDAAKAVGRVVARTKAAAPSPPKSTPGRQATPRPARRRKTA